MRRGPYDDIIGLERPKSRFPSMSMPRRASQFSSFAALDGYGAVLEETARQTEKKPELDEAEVARIEARLVEACETGTPARITWFVPDERKSGGALRTATASVERLDTAAGEVVLADKTRIPFGAVVKADLPEA